MRWPMLIALSLSVLFTLAVCAGLAYYIYRSIQTRSAIGPGWDFDRDEQPVLFWLQLAVVAYFVIEQLARLAHGLGSLVGHS